jgi:di/tricarboxylate transporter
LSNDAVIVLLVLGACFALFVSEKVRLDLVAMGVLLVLSLTGIASVPVALAGFSSPAVVMIAGLFVVGAALADTGVADWMGRRIDRLAGQSEARTVAVVMLVTSLVSAFMSSTGTVAILMPIVGSIARRRRLAPGRLLMPLAFGAHLGSNLTLISTPPNLLVSDALRDSGREPFHFFAFSVPGAVALCAGVACMVFFGRHRLPHGKLAGPAVSQPTPAGLAERFGLAEGLTRLRIGAGSDLADQTLGASNLRSHRAVTVIGIMRGSETVRVVPAARLRAGDELRVIGTDDAIAAAAAAHSLEQVEGHRSFSLADDESLAEVVVRRGRLVGESLRSASFRDRHRATVLALSRVEQGERIIHRDASLRDRHLRAGDTLLLKGRRKYLHRLRDDTSEVVLLDEPDDPADTFVDRYRAIASILVTLVMLFVMAAGVVPNVVAVLAAAFTLALGRCVPPATVYRSVSWESVVLISGMIPLAMCLESTGVTSYAVGAIEPWLGGMSPRTVLLLLVAFTSSLGMVLSNTATAVLVAPVAVRLSASLGIAPEPLLMGVAFAASAAFATPIASPVNALIVNPGGYRFRDFVVVGLPLQLLVLAITVLVVPLVWPF